MTDKAIDALAIPGKKEEISNSPSKFSVSGEFPVVELPVSGIDGMRVG